MTGAFLTGAFLTGAFLTGAVAALLCPARLTASVSRGHTPRANFGALLGESTASLNVLAGAIRARLEALILICSPVAGLRPIRAARSTFTNLANPVINTDSPLDTTAVTTSVNPSRTLDTVDTSTSEWTATALARSRLFMDAIVHTRALVLKIVSAERDRVAPSRQHSPQRPEQWKGAANKTSTTAGQCSTDKQTAPPRVARRG